MSDWVSPTISGIFDLLGGGLNAIYSSGSAKKQYKYNLALQNDAQKHQIDMYKHQNQWRVEDLRAAGLNPILATHAASSMPSSGMNSVSMPNSANFDFKNTAKAIERALFKRSQKESELLDAQKDVNFAQAEKLRAEAQQTRSLTPPVGVGSFFNSAKNVSEKIGNSIGKFFGDLKNRDVINDASEAVPFSARQFDKLHNKYYDSNKRVKMPIIIKKSSSY